MVHDLQQLVLQVADPLRVANVPPVVIRSLQDFPQHVFLAVMLTAWWWNGRGKISAAKLPMPLMNQHHIYIYIYNYYY